MRDVSRVGVFMALRSALKARGVTYSELARRLGTSEPTIKRVFHQQDCKLSRLTAICAAIDLPLETLLEAADTSPAQSAALPPETEKGLAQRPALFHFLVFLMGRFTPSQIRRAFGLKRGSVELYMRDLERLGVIERDVGERFRFRVDIPIAWRWNGPLVPLLKDINRDFVSWTIDHESEPGVKFISLTRRMRRESAAGLQAEAEELAVRFRQAAHRDQLMAPAEEMCAAKMTLALGPFEFADLRCIDDHPEIEEAIRGDGEETH